MDPVEMLIDGAMQHEILQSSNPYLTKETMVLRLYRKIERQTKVSFSQFDKTILFSQFHDEIFTVYDSIKSSMSHDERVCVERVLSKDSPHPTELTKFATCWYKYDPVTLCRWFAVDGILGTHPKAYVHEAFSANFENHNDAVRALYNYYNSPETIKDIVEKAFAIAEDEPCASDLDPEFERCVGLYADMVGEDEILRVANDRRSKLQAQQQPNKRKKKAAAQPPTPSSYEPISPANSP